MNTERDPRYVSAHKPGCSWHVDQYPWECDCGAIVGVNVPSQLPKGVHCKGDYQLGTACGQCERCAHQRAAMGIPEDWVGIYPPCKPNCPGGGSKPRHDDALTERVADHIQQVVMLTRAEALDAARAARFVIENATRP